MKKIVFKVNSQKDFSISSLMKEVSKVSCKISFNLAEGLVTVENVDTSMIDYIIDLINKYYSILSVDIDNTNALSNSINHISHSENAQITPLPADKNSIIENEYIDSLVNTLSKTLNWALSKGNVPEKELGYFILSSISEISLTYNSINCIEFKVGDVVDCNYGTHLPGEINGAHVPSIVCNILSNGMAYLIPITQSVFSTSSNSTLYFKNNKNIIFDESGYAEGTVLLYKAKYLRPERFHKVIGKVTPDFLKTILTKLPSVFNFTNYLSDSTSANSENGNTNFTLDATNVSKSTNTVSITRQTTEQTGLNADALLKAIGPALDKLDKHKSVESQLDGFLSEIGMTKTSKFVREAFIVASKLEDTITFDNLLLELNCSHPYINNVNIIKSSLREDFKNWLKLYPELANRPRLSIISLLKVFAKKFA